MGGKALKEISTRRINQSEYKVLIPKLIQELKKLFPQSIIQDIPFYRDKKDFGDVDILIDSKGLPHSWVDIIKSQFNPKQVVKNGEVLSFEHQNFQIDLIVTNRACLNFSYGYFSYNDLGNLIGRVAHKMGFKFAHNGLRYIMRDENNDSHIVSDIVITQDFYKALDFCGFDVEKHKLGFNTLEEIFSYVKDSHYFDLSCFLLENRSYRDRVRDQKRKTYMEFLDHLENLQKSGVELHKQIFVEEEFFAKALEVFPNLEIEYNSGLKTLEENKIIKSKFNSYLVTELTGLEGKEMGQVIQKVNMFFPDKPSFRNFILTSSQESINAFILERFKELKENKTIRLEILK